MVLAVESNLIIILKEGIWKFNPIPHMILVCDAFTCSQGRFYKLSSPM